MLSCHGQPLEHHPVISFPRCIHACIYVHCVCLCVGMCLFACVPCTHAHAHTHTSHTHTHTHTHTRTQTNTDISQYTTHFSMETHAKANEPHALYLHCIPILVNSVCSQRACGALFIAAGWLGELDILRLQ